MKTICSLGLLDFLCLQANLAVLFYFSSQWEKLQEEDTDPGQLKGIRENPESTRTLFNMTDSKWSLKRVCLAS